MSPASPHGFVGPDVIELHDLQKTYRRWRRPAVAAVDHLDLSVPEGGVFGFLGPNGSGKTTTIRCILGLAHPTAGEVRVLDRPVPRGLPEVMASIGAVVENAAFLPTMSGREQLHLLSRIDGIPPRRADAVLDEVGLGNRADEPVKGYSLGMRQRLALAAALVKDPALLVLDEPANGLDPAGMRDLRQLLRRLGDEGRTVFLSTHLLSEVEQTCDRVAILRSGRCVVSGAVRDLLGHGAASWVVEVAPDVITAAAAAMERSGFAVEPEGSGLRVRGASDGAAINRALGEAGVWVSELRQERAQLEELFLELTAAPTLVGAA